ncbi:hypothetical protein HY489_03995 [Candidatus Woesearchaeota archaeon]|nr:hypothetical protein [Candidatus Woesearchaeota archaeon]
MDTEPLRQAGLTEGEIAVYLALLKLGLSTAGPIVKETKLQSSSAYHILDSLIEKGIISFEMKNKRKNFHAVSPERLIDFIEEKKKKVDEERQQIEKILPSLTALKELAQKPTQEVLIFEGWNGVLSAFKEAYRQLKPGTTAYAYTITKEFGGADLDQVRWLINKIRQLRENMNKKLKRKILMKIIAERGSEIGKDQAKTSFTHVKFIEKHYINPAIINIYGDVTLIALWLQKPIAFYIVSKEVAQSFKNDFDLLWIVAK